MKNPIELLQEVKKLVFQEETMPAPSYSLEDGTKVLIDKLEVGGVVTLEDGSPAPVGEHQLESGEIVVVTEAGKIAEVKKGEEQKVEIEIEAAEEVAPEDPKKDEAMAKFEEVMGALEKKVEELSKKVEEMAKKNEDMKEAVKLSAQVIESLAKEPSDKAITAPNQFAKQLKKDSNDRFNNLQKAFSTLKK